MSCQGREVIEGKISCRKSLRKTVEFVFFYGGEWGYDYLFSLFSGAVKRRQKFLNSTKRHGHLMSMHDLKLFVETFRNFVPVNRID